MAPLAMGGGQHDDVIDAVGRQALAAMAGVSGLPTGGTTRTLLDDRGLGTRRVGRGRDGGVGGVLAQPGFQILDPLLQFLDALEQGRDDGVSLYASWADWLAHTRILRIDPARGIR